TRSKRAPRVPLLLFRNPSETCVIKYRQDLTKRGRVPAGIVREDCQRNNVRKRSDVAGAAVLIGTRPRPPKDLACLVLDFIGSGMQEPDVRCQVEMESPRRRSEIDPAAVTTGESE